MLSFLTAAAKYAIRWAPLVVHMLVSRPDKENPTISAIQSIQDAEQARNDALAAAKIANDRANQVKEDANREREQARARQEEADRSAVRAREDMDQMKRQMAEAADALKRATELSEAASKASAEDAARFAREAQKERERAQEMRDDAERKMKATREEAKKSQEAADEQRRAAEATKARAEEMARAAAEEARKANEARKEAEERLKKGIRPVVTPSREEVAAAKRRIQYREDCFHFAVAGVSGSGKSSLVNAFRGLRGSETGAAAVGVIETTLQTTRYQDANPNNPFVWYDVPGAGTPKCPDWQYFNDQGLYVFDCIIVLFDNRFTVTDIAILTNARRFNLPTYIVRSKADQHIRNIMKHMGYESDGDDEEDIKRRNELYKAARKQFIEATRRSVRANLEDANLPDQRVYIISNSALFNIVLNKMPKKGIDEVDLVNDLFNEAYKRRRVNPVTE